MQSSSNNSCPPPDLVLWKLYLQGVFSRGVFFSQTPASVWLSSFIITIIIIIIIIIVVISIRVFVIISIVIVIVIVSIIIMFIVNVIIDNE